VTERVRVIRPAAPVDLRLTLGPLRRGGLDPTLRLEPGEAWRATRTPAGPATTRITAQAGVLTMRAWGPGATWALEHFPHLVGLGDGAGEFRPTHPVLRELSRRLRGLRVGRSGAVVEALVPTVLEQ
jgi:hypothetical protein